MDIASPWDHRVYEKVGEQINKYQETTTGTTSCCLIPHSFPISFFKSSRFEKGDWKTMGYQTAGSGTSSCWCTRSSKQKVGYMA